MRVESNSCTKKHLLKEIEIYKTWKKWADAWKDPQSKKLQHYFMPDAL